MCKDGKDMPSREGGHNLQMAITVEGEGEGCLTMEHVEKERRRNYHDGPARPCQTLSHRQETTYGRHETIIGSICSAIASGNPLEMMPRTKL